MRTKHTTALLATAIAACFIASSATAATATISSVDDAVPGTSPHMVLAGDGTPRIAYVAPGSKGGESLRLALCADASCATRASQDVALAYGIDAVRVAVGSYGIPVVAHRDFNADANSGVMALTVCQDATCTDPAQTWTIADVPADAFGTSFAIAIGEDNRPLLSFFGGDGLYVAKCNEAACGKGEVTLTRIAAGPLTGFDSDISATGGAAFGSSTIGSVRGGQLPVVTYATTDPVTFEDQLRLARCADTACTAISSDMIIDRGTWVGWDASMSAVGGDTRVAYFATGNLRVAENGVVTTIDGTRTTGLHASITRGADGASAIAYYRSANAEDTLVDDLWFARCASTGCASGGVQPVLIDATGRTRRPSVVVTTDDLPLIAYLEDEAGTLKIAKCGTRDCR